MTICHPSPKDLWHSLREQLNLGEGEHPELQGWMDTRSKLTLVWGTQSITNFLLEERFMGRGHKWIQDIELSFCEIILDYYYSMIKKKKMFLCLTIVTHSEFSWCLIHSHPCKCISGFGMCLLTGIFTPRETQNIGLLGPTWFLINVSPFPTALHSISCHE